MAAPEHAEPRLGSILTSLEMVGRFHPTLEAEGTEEEIRHRNATLERRVAEVTAQLENACAR